VLFSLPSLSYVIIDLYSLTTLLRQLLHTDEHQRYYADS